MPQLRLWIGLLTLGAVGAVRPVVLLHGLNSGAGAMSLTQSWIEADFPGIYVNNVEIGDGKHSSMFMDINKQVEAFAHTVASDPKLAQGFNLIAHSQGGLISRAYVERYNNPPVYNLISWAGPQMGVYGVPDFNAICPDKDCPWLDELMAMLLNNSWIDPIFQRSFSFAAYWKDPLQYETYLEHNIFLSDINNEKAVKNATYKANIESLHYYALFYSTKDLIVVPKISPWFEFYTAGQDSKIEPVNQTDFWLQDFIGLRTLSQRNSLSFGSLPCTHGDIPRDVCKAYSYDGLTRSLLNNTI